MMIINALGGLENPNLALLRPQSDNPVEVTVIGNYQVNHEGTTYGPGQTVTVPAALAEHWQLCGYVQLA